MGFFKKKYQHRSDEELMVLLAKGDESALGELYQRFAPKMHRYFYRMLGQNQELASDHTQDLFLHVMERPHLFDPDRKFSTWLYTIASNRCKNVYRSWSRQPAKVDVADQEITLTTTAADDLVDQSFFTEALKEAVDFLPAAQKECFILRYQEELSIQEIADIADCPPGTVKSRLHYALKQLAEKLRHFKVQNSKS